MTDLTDQEMDALAGDISQSLGLSKSNCRSVLREIEKRTEVNLSRCIQAMLTGNLAPAQELPAISGATKAPPQFSHVPMTRSLSQVQMSEAIQAVQAIPGFGATGEPAADDPATFARNAVPETGSGKRGGAKARASFPAPEMET
jgi:hypothetical protein